MKNNKRIALVLASAIAIFGAYAPAQASNDTSWIPTDVNYSEPSVHSFAFVDRMPLPNQFSLLLGDSYPDFYVCHSSSDPECDQSRILKYNSILKVCSTAADTDCVAEVSAFDSSGTKSSGTFSKYTVKDHFNAYPADPVAGIPEGSMPSIWSIPSAPHNSGSEYAVVAGINGNTDRQGHETSSGSYIQIALVPVYLKDFGTGKASIAEGWSQAKPGVFYDYCVTYQQTATNKNADCNHVNGEACILPTNDQGKCYAEEPFGDVQRFNVQVRLSKEPSAWIHGRMVDPSISITPVASGGVNLSVTAGATSVPMVYQTGKWTDLPDNVKQLWLDCTVDGRLCSEAGLFRGPNVASNFMQLATTLEGNAQINILDYLYPFGKVPLKIMAAIAPLVGDKSNAMSSTWMMRTLSGLEMKDANPCFTNTKGIKGIVSTNSTAYSAGPPEFVDGYLNYKVSSPHFNPDGKTPFKGNYNLVMRSDVARCLYGFSSAPISASISVLSSEGTSDVATTVTGEKNGWLSLSANNFQFSEPTIQVKLTQEAPKKEEVAPASSPSPTATKASITCVKGKITKKVTAANPVCPKGYKKK